jgi:hypothetical protein
LILFQWLPSKKVKFTLEQATKALRGVEVLLHSFINLGAIRGWVVNATLWPLYQVPIV